MDEEEEILEAKNKIDKEVEELEVRIAEEQEDSDYEDADVIERRVAPIKKELAKIKELQKFAEERLLEIRKSKNIQAKEEDEEDTSFTIAIIDLIDADHYADIVDEERYAWVGWRGVVVYPNYDKIVALADRLFWALNPDKKTQKEWCEFDDGYDVQVYDKNMSCVYKAHEKLPKKEITIPKVGDIIYLEAEFEMGDIILGGKAKISDVENHPRQYFIKVEGFPELTFGWQFLEPKQEELKKKFGEQWFHREA